MNVHFYIVSLLEISCVQNCNFVKFVIEIVKPSRAQTQIIVIRKKKNRRKRIIVTGGIMGARNRIPESWHSVSNTSSGNNKFKSNKTTLLHWY